MHHAMECITGLLHNLYIVHIIEEQKEKKYFGRLSHLAKVKSLNIHVTQDFHQTRNSGVVKGSWVGGDACFGSIEYVRGLEYSQHLL